MHVHETGMLIRFRRGGYSDGVSKDQIPFPCQTVRAIALQPVLSRQVMHANDKREMLIRFRRGRHPDSVPKVLSHLDVSPRMCNGPSARPVEPDNQL